MNLADVYDGVKRLGSGLVFGKFMPLTNGHLHFLRVARQSVNRLTILVCSLAREPIPGEIRFQWVKEEFPDANVVHHYAELPQDPSEHPDFWNIWKNTIAKHCPGEEFDVLFGSEDYGWKMAEVLGVQYIPVDRQRDQVPISGTAMREDPMRHWDYLPEVVRPYFVKRVSIVGPESAGKSVLADRLAKHFKTVRVAEYGRTLLEEYQRSRGYKPGEIHYQDISTIARGHIASEDSLARQANRVLICDTELLTTVFWSRFFFNGKSPHWVDEEAKKRSYDLYLLMDADVPWVDDGSGRVMTQEQREECVGWWERELTHKQRPFVKISGLWDERLEKAKNYVAQLTRFKQEK